MKSELAPRRKRYRCLAKNLNYVGYVKDLKHRKPFVKRRNHGENESHSFLVLFCFLHLLNSDDQIMSSESDYSDSVLPAAAVCWLNMYLPSAGKREVSIQVQICGHPFWEKDL